MSTPVIMRCSEQTYWWLWCHAIILFLQVAARSNGWICKSLKLLNDSIFVPPAAIYSLFHGFSSIRTAVAPSMSLDQRHGTCSKTICVSRTCKLTVFVVHRRRFFLISSTRHIDRIRGAFCDDTLYKLTLTFTLHLQHINNIAHWISLRPRWLSQNCLN